MSIITGLLDYWITVEKNDLPYVCMNCRCVIRDGQNREDIFKPHQTKERIVSDLAFHGKAVRIVIRHKRYKCTICNGTFYELLDSVE